jgi:ribosomal protein S18 acetylase RimI-like enzyme
MPTMREATQQDQGPVCGLWEEAGFGRTEDREWASLIAAPTAAVILAEEDGRLVGAAVASYDGWRAYVYHVAVAPEFRRRGIGRALMAEAQRYLGDHQARRAYLIVNEGNAAGLALAAVAGFEPEGDIVFAREFAIPLPAAGATGARPA